MYLLLMYYVENATEKELMSFLNEAEIMKRLSQQACPYIVQLVGIQVERAPALIVMELVPCGNLLEILRSSTITVSVFYTACVVYSTEITSPQKADYCMSRPL